MFIDLVRPKGQLAEHIKQLTFELHPTFYPNKVVMKKPPFQITRTGWGYFTIGIAIVWKPELGLEDTKLEHELNFYQNTTYQLHQIKVDMTKMKSKPENQANVAATKKNVTK